jgi:hypothetical protein
MTGNTDMHLLVTDTLKRNGPQDLVIVFLSIQITIDKMQLYLLSIAYACPPWCGGVMVDKLTFNLLAIALVDIPAVNMPIAHFIKT